MEKPSDPGETSPETGLLFGSASGRDPSFYAKKRAVEKALGRTLAHKEFARDFYPPRSGQRPAPERPDWWREEALPEEHGWWCWVGWPAVYGMDPPPIPYPEETADGPRELNVMARTLNRFYLDLLETRPHIRWRRMEVPVGSFLDAPNDAPNDYPGGRVRSPWRAATTAKARAVEQRRRSSPKRRRANRPHALFRPDLLPDPRLLSVMAEREGLRIILAQALAEEVSWVLVQQVADGYKFRANPHALVHSCCFHCGRPLTDPAGGRTLASTGRPPRYCSADCRREVEFERQRMYRRLRKLSGR